MKPYEQDWACVLINYGDTNEVELHWGEGQVHCTRFGITTVDDMDDAYACKLAAAAPEMARLLLRIHEQTDGAAFSRTELVDVLRKAGVLL